MSPVTWIVIGLLIAANSLYVAAEFGAVGVRRNRVRRLCDDGNPFARWLMPFVETPQALDRYVGASQIGITLSSLVLGAYAQATVSVTLAPSMASLFALEPTTARQVAAIVVLAILTAVQLVVGELVPKALALQYPTQTALFTVLLMRWSLRIFRPFLALLNGTATLILRLFGSRMDGHRHLHSPEEIELLIAESRDGGLLEPEEQERLHRALRLSQRTARDLMVPREKLTMLSIDAAWDEVVRTVSASPFSRLPIYRGAADEIVGTLRVKDLLYRYVTEGPLPVEKLMRPLTPVAETLGADRVLTLLRERRAHQAVVVNAAGSSVGLITIQDVLGELLGPPAVAAGAGRT